MKPFEMVQNLKSARARVIGPAPEERWASEVPFVRTHVEKLALGDTESMADDDCYTWPTPLEAGPSAEVASSYLQMATMAQQIVGATCARLAVAAE